MTPKEFVTRLEAVAAEEGMPRRRLQLIVDAQTKHAEQTLQYRGYSALSAAFRCFFLQTVECLNLECRPKVTEELSEFYPFLIERLAQCFSTICAAEHIAISGYPLQGYTLLRNVFDGLVLTSAAAQGMTDFYKLEGLDTAKTFDPTKFRKLRRKEEEDVRTRMTGKDSGLSPVTLEALANWDKLFDDETHGALLTRAQSIDWLKGKQPLPTLPIFNELSFAMYMNRFCEVAWMLHRLLPLLQPPGIPFSDFWKQKWRNLDECFQEAVESLTKQLGKQIGTSIVELVRAKFPFSQDSHFWAR